MRRRFLVSLLAFLIGGCIGTAAQRAEWAATRQANLHDVQFVTNYNDCVRETGSFGLIPDFGVTRDAHFFKCMEAAGWVQTPRWNPAAVGRYHRAVNGPASAQTIVPTGTIAEERHTPMAQCQAWAKAEAKAVHRPAERKPEAEEFTLERTRKGDPKKQQELENQLTASCLMQQMMPGNRVSVPKPRRQTSDVPLCPSGEYWSSSTERCQKIGE